ncbi:MAG TPA: hypothetical protein VNH64_02115 [Parvularculaceae bacterium]|nr:hypothetical protein [Parvularculaceae bacterium]
MASNKPGVIYFDDQRALARVSPEEIEKHRGEYVVLAGGKIESFHATNGEALIVACKKHQYDQFSVRRL